MASGLTPPARDEFEITVLGPGYGESIVVHLGDDRWLVNDSCMDRDSGRPAALQYLEAIGVSAATAVELVVASHWHDDHTAGLGSVFATCTSAKFVCSQALKGPHFLELVKVAESDPSSLPSSLSEFYSVIRTVRDREAADPTRVVMEWASSDKVLWRGENGIVVHSLAPSSSSTLATLVEIAGLVEEVRRDRIRVPPNSLNDTSVVVWIEYPDGGAMLGGDLERHADARRGWDAIVSSTTRPPGTASAYKVAHHGSITGHAEGIYGVLVGDPNIQVVTPFFNGGVRLPTRDDVERIVGNSTSAFVTSLAPRGRPARGRVVTEVVRASTRHWSIAEPLHGRVTMRRRLGDSEWRTDAIPPAGGLSAFGATSTSPASKSAKKSPRSRR